MTAPRLSVIVPSFNTARFIPGCVQSVNQAGIEGGFEIVLVDDGSTDNTREIAAEQGVKYLHQTNQKQPAARNAGVQISTGTYLTFLDVDDRFHPGLINLALDFLDRRPDVPVVYFDADVGNDETGWRSMLSMLTPTVPPVSELPRSLDGEFQVFEPTAYRLALATRNLVFLGAAIVRRSAFEATGGFDITTTGAEDWYICLQLSEHGPFAHNPRRLTKYYRHDANYSNDHDKMVRAFCQVRRVYLKRARSLTSAMHSTLERGLLDESIFHADLAYGRGDYSEAARRYRAVYRESGWSRRVAYGLAMTTLPRPIIDRLRGRRN